ncbi:MAG TPA: hypothetical protein VKY73_11675 [Polyangiaceae bacterium]|nr:hypothetical protein [Polyangiaceae bacterium]
MKSLLLSVLSGVLVLGVAAPSFAASIDKPSCGDEKKDEKKDEKNPARL